MAIDAAQLRVVVSADTSKAQSELKSFSGSMKSMTGSMGAVGGVMAAAISAPLIGIGVSAIKTAATFEKSMNVLGYVTEGTAAQMQAMSDQALQLGADTVFSANEAAEGMVELAKAGMDTEDVMGAIPGVMDLAAAGQISVAEAATLASATLNTFGLEAEKSGEVADILAAAANASSADIRDLAFGVQNAGSVFATSGQSVETLATMMALLANNGLNASDAATSLKTMTMRLTAPTATAAKVMKNLGIAVFDADGNMRDYRDIVQDMEAATEGMSDAQRSAAFSTIFGADAIRAANIMVQEGAAGYDAMATAVSEQGAASEMAAAQNSGLAGAMEAISGSVDTLFTKLALPFLDTIAEQMGKLTEFVNGLGELEQPVINAGLAFLGLAVGIGLVLLAAAGAAGVIGALATPVGLVALAVLLLGLAVAGLWAAWELNWGNIQTKTEEVMGVVTPLLETFATNLGTAATNIGALLAVNPQWQTLITNIEAVVTAASGLSEIKLPDLSNFGMSTTKTNIEMGLVVAFKEIQLDWSTLTWSTDILVTQVGAELSKITWAGLVADFSGLMTVVGEQLTKAANAALGEDNIVTRTMDKMGKTLTTIQDEFADLDLSDPIETIKSIFTMAHSLATLFSGIKTDVMTTAVTALESVITTILNFGTTLVDSIDATTLAEAATGIVTGLTDAIATVVDADTLGAIGTAAGNFVSSLVTKLGEVMGSASFGVNIGEAIGEAMVAIAEGATSMASHFADELGATDWGQFAGQLRDFVMGLITGIVSQIGPALLEASIFDKETREEAVKPENFWADMPFMRDMATALTGAIQGGFADVGAGLAADMAGAMAQQRPAAITSGLVMGRPEGPAPVDWGKPPALEWPELPAELTGYQFPAPTKLEAYQFPAPTLLESWSFPRPDELYEWGWPHMSTPGWVGTLISILGGGAAAAGGGGGGGGTGGFQGEATGTPYFKGGMTWVGEHGPELVRLPQGSRIWSNGESMAAAGGVTINVYANVASDIDVEALAVKVANKFRQKMR